MTALVNKSSGKPIDVVIMAAGKGTRMKSALPKVLHRLGGLALLGHVVDCAALLSTRRAVIITGHGAIEVEAACARRNRRVPALNRIGFQELTRFLQRRCKIGTVPIG